MTIGRPVVWRVIRAHALEESNVLRLFAAQGRCPSYTTQPPELPADAIAGVGICACGEPFTQAGKSTGRVSCSQRCADRRKRAQRKARESGQDATRARFSDANASSGLRDTTERTDDSGRSAA